MNQEARRSNYLTGAASYEDDRLVELVMYCYDPPTPEMEAIGFMEQDYIASVDAVIANLKDGATLVARFVDREDGEQHAYPVEIVTVDGKETLEIVQVGQPEKHRSLRNLGEPGNAESNGWRQKFYDEFLRLTKGSVGMMEASYLAADMYDENPTKDPIELAREYYEHSA